QKTKVGDSLLLDDRPSGDGKLEEAVTNRNTLDDHARKAVIGYARLDLIEKKEELRFGYWNDRPLKKAQVNSLVQSFLTKGADRFSVTKAIPLVVSQSEMKPGTYKTSYTPGVDAAKDLPILELNDSAKGKKRLVAAGGQHRLHAIQEWLNMLKKTHKEMARDRQHVEGQDTDNVAEMDIDIENHSRKAKRDAIEETLALRGQWLVILYDTGEWCSLSCRIVYPQINRRLGMHLSENESDHVYRQTPEEGMLNMFRVLKEGKNTYRDVEPIQGVKGTPRKWVELLSQDYVWDMMERMEPMGIHMFDGSPQMKLHRFHGTMIGTGGGILSYMVAQMETYVCECFNEVEVDEAEVDRLFAVAWKNTKKGKDARTELREIYAEMKDAGSKMHSARGAVYAIRQCMDEAFVQHLGPLSEVGMLFGNQRSERWKDAVEDYYAELIEELPNVISSITRTNNAVDEEDQAGLRSLEWCVAKIKVLRQMLSWTKADESFGVVPFMSREVFGHMAKRLEVIDAPLLEFCRWWEPLIDMVPAIGTYWAPGSASAAMVRAVQCHREIKEVNRKLAVRCVVYVVWNDYASLVNMEQQLIDLSAPNRITMQKKLLALFGVNSEGRDLKDLRKARDATTGIAAKKKKNMTTATATATTTATRKGKGKEKEKETTKGKGKGKSKGKGKGKDEVEDEEDDNGEDEDEDEDGGDDDDDSAWSNEDDDGVEDDEDDEGTKKHAKVSRVTTMEKHVALLERHEEWKEINALITGSKHIIRDKDAPTLNFNKIPNFSQSWKKISRVSKDKPFIGKRGLALVDWTTWEWKNMPTKSFPRVMRTLSAAAIAEAAVIISYRQEMIFCDPHGGAATLRLRVQQALGPLLMPKDAGQSIELVQTTLKDLLRSASQGSKEGQGKVLTEGNLPPKGCMSWADGIYIIAANNDITEHIIEDELALLEREKSLGEQRRAVQKAMNGVQKLAVAWRDSTGTAQERDHPPLDDEVASALHLLVKALNVNAYRQRVVQSRMVSFDPALAFAPRERLRINIRSETMADDEQDERFLMGAPKMFQFLEIPTKSQSIKHLEDLFKLYDQWSKAHDERVERTTEKFQFVKEKALALACAETVVDDEDEDGEGSTEEEEDVKGTTGPAIDKEDNGGKGMTDVEEEEEVFDPDLGDIGMFDYYPANSDGEFLSSDESPPPSNQLVIRHSTGMLLFSSGTHVLRISTHRPNALEVHYTRVIAHFDTSPPLDKLVEIDEHNNDDKNMDTNAGVPVTAHTTSKDDANDTTQHTPPNASPIIPTQQVFSPRQRTLQKPRKRDRAPTMSSTGSAKDDAE
ncbi:hypothetical protein EV363DRAFT_1132290, partial [Boletus edulis]